MDDEEFSIAEPISQLCSKCGIEHKCKRCMRTIHLCMKCGKIMHECDICGVIMDSMSGIHRHQNESKICKKARNLTIVNMDTYMDKYVDKFKIIKQKRRKSVY